jgi:hypothetical protein
MVASSAGGFPVAILLGVLVRASADVLREAFAILRVFATIEISRNALRFAESKSRRGAAGGDLVRLTESRRTQNICNMIGAAGIEPTTSLV